LLHIKFLYGLIPYKYSFSTLLNLGANALVFRHRRLSNQEENKIYHYSIYILLRIIYKASFAYIAILGVISFHIDYMSAFGFENDKGNLEKPTSNLTNSELASLANKCLSVVKNELRNHDMPVAFTFLGITEKVISAIEGNTSNPDNLTVTVQPGICDWFDPESKAQIR